MAGLDATETGYEISQPKFEFTRLIIIEEEVEEEGGMNRERSTFQLFKASSLEFAGGTENLLQI